jgi:hypothetical protein
MRREFHVRFCEGVGVRFPRATRLVILVYGTKQEALDICSGSQKLDSFRLTAYSPERGIHRCKNIVLSNPNSRHVLSSRF